MKVPSLNPIWRSVRLWNPTRYKTPGDLRVETRNETVVTSGWWGRPLDSGPMFAVELPISSNFDEEIPLIKEKIKKTDYPLRLRTHPLSTYAISSEKLTFLNLWYAHVRVRIRGLEMLSFSENIGYVLNG